MFDNEMSTHFDKLHKTHFSSTLTITLTCFPELSVADSNL